VAVITGDKERAETDADIFCTVIGQWGDTGQRVLVRSKTHKEPFRRGQVQNSAIFSYDGFRIMFTSCHDLSIVRAVTLKGGSITQHKTIRVEKQTKNGKQNKT
jgi:hypothetical protein